MFNVFKVLRVILIFKFGDVIDFVNYRFIVVLLLFSKILEKIVND